MLKLKFRAIVAAAAALGMAALFASPAHAVQIFIQQSGSSPAGGTAIGGESNLITDTSAFVLGVAGGNFIGNNPLLVVVGTFDGIGTPEISYSGCGTSPTFLCSAPASNLYGFTATTANYTSLSTGTAYDQLGTPTNGGSVSFGNWSTIDQDNGFGTPTSFTLDVFAVPVSLANNGANANSPITIDESGAAPGSFIIAYDCSSSSGTGTCKGNDEAETVNTNTGLIVPAPEIGHGLTVALAIGGLLFGAKLWERTKKQRALSAAVPHAEA
jgi:hypothetical protein